MIARFAEKTDVSVERSRSEIDGLLAKAGASQRGIVHDDELGTATIAFRLEERHVRMTVRLPKIEDFTKTTRNVNQHERKEVLRKPEELRRVHEQACRQRWRQMALLVKAKLEAVAIGVSTVEREFLADIFLADGRTLHEALAKPLGQMYLDGKIPKKLLLLGQGDGT